MTRSDVGSNAVREADQVSGLFALLIIAGSLSAAVLFVLGGLGQ